MAVLSCRSFGRSWSSCSLYLPAVNHITNVIPTTFWYEILDIVRASLNHATAAWTFFYVSKHTILKVSSKISRCHPASRYVTNLKPRWAFNNVPFGERDLQSNDERQANWKWKSELFFKYPHHKIYGHMTYNSYNGPCTNFTCSLKSYSRWSRCMKYDFR